VSRIARSDIIHIADITELDAGKVGSVTWPEPSDLTNMKLTVRPDKGLWAGAPFTFSIRIPDGYPHDAPKVLCETKVRCELLQGPEIPSARQAANQSELLISSFDALPIGCCNSCPHFWRLPLFLCCSLQIYHPNIDLEGHVCLNILRDEWKPIYDINTVIYGVIYLFYEPNANDPLNHEAAQCALITSNTIISFRLLFLLDPHSLAFPLSLSFRDAVMRDDKATFESNVKTSLRGGILRINQKTGGTVTVSFPKLL
jgi:ubiquitin-protein ligase